MKLTAPVSLLIIFAFAIYFFAFIFSFIKPKIQKYLAALYFVCGLFILSITTPLSRRLASICYLCAGTVHVVLRGSPTGSITLISSLREIPTVVMLHHPFLFGEKPT